MRRLLLPLFSTVLLAFGVVAIPAHAQDAPGASISTPAINVSALVAPQGHPETVSGTGFVPNSSALIEITLPGGTVTYGQIPTDASGNFTTTFRLSPDNGAGTETIAAFDYKGHWVSVSVTVTGPVTPPVPFAPGTAKLSLSSNTLAAGNAVTVTGSGFSASSSVYLSWTAPNGTQSSAILTTSGSGGFSLSVPVTASNGAGTEAFYAIDSATNTTAPVTLLTVTAS